MTTIAYRDGILAADSQVSYESETAGTRKHLCETKLFRKSTSLYGEVIIATQGESSPGMIFVDWFGSKRTPPAVLWGAQFCCLVLRRDGLFEYDGACRGEKVFDRFYAIGSGANAALGAMHRGASAKEAVEIASRIDLYTGGPITTMRLKRVK